MFCVWNAVPVPAGLKMLLEVVFDVVVKVGFAVKVGTVVAGLFYVNVLEVFDCWNVFVVPDF